MSIKTNNFIAVVSKGHMHIEMSEREILTLAANILSERAPRVLADARMEDEWLTKIYYDAESHSLFTEEWEGEEDDRRKVSHPLTADRAAVENFLAVELLRKEAEAVK